MPVCSLHLVALDPSTDLASFLALAAQQSPAPLVAARVIRWIIRPSVIAAAALLTHQWDLLLVFAAHQATLPTALAAHAHAVYTVHAGVPTRLTTGFGARNAALLRPAADAVPALKGTLDAPPGGLAADSQALELSAELRGWLRRWDPEGRRGAVSMLNLLAFRRGMHGEYQEYGRAFAGEVGASRGGVAKLVGRTVPAPGEPADAMAAPDRWEEIALAHYPSIYHFAEMAASEDYQRVNHRYRVGSLKDTCILCTSELELPSADVAKSRL